MIKFYGVGVSPSVAYGKLKFFDLLTNEPCSSSEAASGSQISELEKYRSAKKQLELELGELERMAYDSGGAEAADIFSFYRLMLDDDDLELSVCDRISNVGMSAEVAVSAAIGELSDIFKSLPNEYMREREADLLALRDRLLKKLGGHGAKIELDSHVIIAAVDLTPADTVELQGHGILGFALEKGSGNSHTAILARGMGIPAVCQLGELPRELDGKTALIDGERGCLIIEPSCELIDDAKRRQAVQSEIRLRNEALRGKPTVSKNGKKIKLLANVGDLNDVKRAVESDAEGVGLLRSEFLYLEHENVPSEDEQLDIYRKTIAMLNGRELIIRTLDIGADKELPYMKLSEERNPALGLRGIRASMAYPDIFASQMRAILRASAYGDVGIMLPMVSTEDEVEWAITVLDEAKAQLLFDGAHIGRVSLGIMIETPSAALISDKLAKRSDFFSIGTNDLTQYTIAADRENGALSNLNTSLPESVKKLIEMTVSNAKMHGIPVSVCGEAAGEAENAPYFLSLGIDKLSISPLRILDLRHTISELNV